MRTFNIDILGEKKPSDVTTGLVAADVVVEEIRSRESNEPLSIKKWP
jgi:hypothetical protein